MKNIYLDEQTIRKHDFPPGAYAIYVPEYVSEEARPYMIVPERLEVPKQWKFSHKIVRFYLFKKGFVISWRRSREKFNITLLNGTMYFTFGRLGVNIFNK